MADGARSMHAYALLLLGSIGSSGSVPVPDESSFFFLATLVFALSQSKEQWPACCKWEQKN
jgi:hypothetical protein